MFKEYVTEQDICDVMCRYSVDDTVTLLESSSTENGIIEAGTEMIVKKVSLNSCLHIPKVFKNDLSEYDVPEKAFMLDLALPEKDDIRIYCSASKVELGQISLSARDLNKLYKQKNSSIHNLLFMAIAGISILAAIVLFFATIVLESRIYDVIMLLNLAISVVACWIHSSICSLEIKKTRISKRKSVK